MFIRVLKPHIQCSYLLSFFLPLLPTTASTIPNTLCAVYTTTQRKLNHSHKSEWDGLRNWVLVSEWESECCCHTLCKWFLFVLLSYIMHEHSKNTHTSTEHNTKTYIKRMLWIRQEENDVRTNVQTERCKWFGEIEIRENDMGYQASIQFYDGQRRVI